MSWIDHENKIQYWHGSCLRDLTLAIHILQSEGSQSNRNRNNYVTVHVQYRAIITIALYYNIMYTCITL